MKILADPAAEWESYYAGLSSDRKKVDFLLMLKERRDRYQDPAAQALFAKLGEAWLTEKFKP